VKMIAVKMGNIFVIKSFPRWHVKEEGVEIPIATCMEKGDAMTYAVSVAKTKASAGVKVFDERGGVLSERRLAMESVK
jgi:hypothetical protein